MTSAIVPSMAYFMPIEDPLAEVMALPTGTPGEVIGMVRNISGIIDSIKCAIFLLDSCYYDHDISKTSEDYEINKQQALEDKVKAVKLLDRSYDSLEKIRYWTKAESSRLSNPELVRVYNRAVDLYAVGLDSYRLLDRELKREDVVKDSDSVSSAFHSPQTSVAAAIISTDRSSASGKKRKYAQMNGAAASGGAAAGSGVRDRRNVGRPDYKVLHTQGKVRVDEWNPSNS